jgi:arabinan endo-1,5-alpha-L-arabinosidase
MALHLTYRNPVWEGYFADPFVLKWQGEYYAYGTGDRAIQEDGHVFPVLHSLDLAHWKYLGGALKPFEAAGSAYWAPEVVEREGRFYLYYSLAGPEGDETHRLHVAVADHPAGPFVDAKPLLPNEGFSIDAHPFQDPADGQWYLFFAKDFFEGRAGTALAAVRLSADMVSTIGPVTTILRPSADWQIYERDRSLYGRQWDAWHTVEGPGLVMHNGRYYLMYSGGNWTSAGYGIGYAVAETVLGPYQEPEAGPVVLSGNGAQVIGPGHNSTVLGPDDQTRFVVYHAWDAARTARRMCIDPLAWSDIGPRCLGPTWTKQTITLHDS